MSRLDGRVDGLEAGRRPVKSPVRSIVERHDLGNRPREEAERADSRWQGYTRARAEAFLDQVLRAYGPAPAGVSLAIANREDGTPGVVLSLDVADGTPEFFAADSYASMVVEDEAQLLARYDATALRRLSDWRSRYLAGRTAVPA